MLKYLRPIHSTRNTKMASVICESALASGHEFGAGGWLGPKTADVLPTTAKSLKGQATVFIVRGPHFVRADGKLTAAGCQVKLRNTKKLEIAYGQFDKDFNKRPEFSPPPIPPPTRPQPNPLRPVPPQPRPPTPPANKATQVHYLVGEHGKQGGTGSGGHPGLPDTNQDPNTPPPTPPPSRPPTPPRSPARWNTAARLFNMDQAWENAVCDVDRDIGTEAKDDPSKPVPKPKPAPKSAPPPRPNTPAPRPGPRL